MGILDIEPLSNQFEFSFKIKWEVADGESSTCRMYLKSWKHYTAQAAIKIAGRHINNLSYADTTLMAASEEELKSILVKVKEEGWGETGLKLNIQKTKIMAFGPTTSRQIGK